MIPDELVFSWTKERSEAKENICTGQQHPKKAETPSALSSVKSQADRVHLECSDRADGRVSCQQPGSHEASMARRRFSLFHMLLPHTYHFHPKQMFKQINNPFAVLKG